MSPKRKSYTGFYQQHPPLPQDEKAHRQSTGQRPDRKSRQGMHHPHEIVEAGAFLDHSCTVRCEHCGTEHRVAHAFVLGPCSHCGGHTFQVLLTH